MQDAQYMKYLTKEKKAPDSKYIGSNDVTTLEKQRRVRKIMRLLFLMSLNKQMKKEENAKKTRAARFAEEKETLNTFPCMHLYAHHYIC